MLQREEILDAATRIAGYRFSVHVPGGNPARAQGEKAAFLHAHHLAQFAQRRLALVQISVQEWREQEYRGLIGPHTVFQLDYTDDDPIETWLATVAEMHQSGARVALSTRQLGRLPAVVTAQPDYLLVDFTGHSLAHLEKILAAHRRDNPALQFIVEQVGRWPEFRYCIAHDIAHCLGPFTLARDEEQASHEIGQSRLVLMDMLERLRQDGELQDIAEIARRDPGVVLRLMSMVNSPALGLHQAITSIDQAILFLGREQLHHWIAIALFRTGDDTPRDEVLLELALARGRFLELLGQCKLAKPECDELFLLGMLSLLDILFGLPMDSVVNQIHLSPALKAALLSSDGPLRGYLLLAIAVEKGHIANICRHAEQLGFPLATVDNASTQAMTWAEEAARLSA